MYYDSQQGCMIHYDIYRLPKINFTNYVNKTTIIWKHVCLFFYSVYTILQVILSQQWSGVLPELCFYVSKYKLYLHIQQLPKLYHIHSQLLFYKFLLYLQ